MKAKKKQSAFTLIELLVVIAIIGILATLAIVALQQARQNARDAKRVADVKQISTALEMYFNDNQLYPETLDELQTNGYMEQLPEAPTPADEGCSPEKNEYVYVVDDERGTYQVSFCTGKQISDMSPGVLCMTPGGISTDCSGGAEATSGTFIDARDGQEYAWVKIGDQVWMAENLNYDNGCSSVVWVDYSDEGWCGYYNNDEATYSDYGLLYQWSAAMNGTTTEGAQGICPDGWHLPSHDEWTDLERAVCTSASCETDFPYDETTTGYRGTNEGSKLAGEYDLWNDDVLRQNTDFGISGFNALPAGSRYSRGVFYYLGDNTYFWSSSEDASGYSWYRKLHSYDSKVDRGSYSQAYGYSVRCLKND